MPITVDEEQTLFYLEGSLISPNVLKCSMSSSYVAYSDSLYSYPFHSFEFEEAKAGRDLSAFPENNRDLSFEIFNPNPNYSDGTISLPKPVQYYFHSKGEDGSILSDPKDLVHCWFLPPAQFAGRETEAEEAAASGSVPLVLIIHGGPQGAINNAWNYRWNLAYYSALGYGVVAVNFHGSTGFGGAYLDSIRGDWGGQPYRDCMACVDFILGEKKYLNASRVGALGASYGGFMVNWINGHDPEGKFKCLVIHDGIFGLKNLYYTTEELWFPEWEFGVPYITNASADKNRDTRYDTYGAAGGGAEGAVRSGPSMYDLYDPCNFVDQWNTPTLVIQGCKDHRVVETEGIATFTALQRRGIASKLLVFPDENHWCLRAVNSMRWHETVTKWLEQFLKV